MIHKDVLFIQPRFAHEVSQIVIVTKSIVSSSNIVENIYWVKFTIAGYIKVSNIIVCKFFKIPCFSQNGTKICRVRSRDIACFNFGTTFWRCWKFHQFFQFIFFVRINQLNFFIGTALHLPQIFPYLCLYILNNWVCRCYGRNQWTIIRKIMIAERFEWIVFFILSNQTI